MEFLIFKIKFMTIMMKYNYVGQMTPHKLFNLDLITKKIICIESCFSLIHVGILLIEIIGMFRKGSSTKVMANLVDTRHMHSISKVVIGVMKADMNNNSKIVYLTPEYLVSLSTLFKHIKLIIKSKCYHMINNEPNLLVPKSFTSQIALYSRIRYTSRTNKIGYITKILGSKAIKAILAKYYDYEILGKKNGNKTNKRKSFFFHYKHNIMNTMMDV